jgi:diacylglycerol kinase (ATP)
MAADAVRCWAPLSRLPPELDRVLISVNPTAGRLEARPVANHLADRLRAQGLRPEIVEDLDAMADQAAHWQQCGQLRAVVAAGGDGTMAEIVNRTPPGSPAAVLPLGTENLLAKYLYGGRAPSPEEVCQTIAAGRVAQLDAGRATSGPATAVGKPRGRLFLLMASAGLDADVVYRLEQTRRGHISHFSYFKPIWQAVRSYNYPELRIDGGDVPDGSEVGPGDAGRALARWMFLFNLPCYARGLAFTPRARGDDGMLDLCTFEKGSFWQGLKYLAAVLAHRHERLRDSRIQQVRWLRVESEVQVPYQLDGDFGGFLPLEIEVLPGRLTLLVP